jgi:hypothetical protein
LDVPSDGITSSKNSETASSKNSEIASSKNSEQQGHSATSSKNSAQDDASDGTEIASSKNKTYIKEYTVLLDVNRCDLPCDGGSTDFDGSDGCTVEDVDPDTFRSWCEPSEFEVPFQTPLIEVKTDSFFEDTGVGVLATVWVPLSAVTTSVVTVLDPPTATDLSIGTENQWRDWVKRLLTVKPLSWRDIERSYGIRDAARKALNRAIVGLQIEKAVTVDESGLLHCAA